MSLASATMLAMTLSFVAYVTAATWYVAPRDQPSPRGHLTIARPATGSRSHSSPRKMHVPRGDQPDQHDDVQHDEHGIARDRVEIEQEQHDPGTHVDRHG